MKDNRDNGDGMDQHGLCYPCYYAVLYRKRRKIMFEKISLSGVDNTGWLRLRKSGIGGSDAGAICGVNPFSNAMKVFKDKTSIAYSKFIWKIISQAHPFCMSNDILPDVR